MSSYSKKLILSIALASTFALSVVTSTTVVASTCSLDTPIAAVAAKPKIIATIRPLQMLVDQIRFGAQLSNGSINEADMIPVLLFNNQDHHLSTLKPSQLSLINNADIVFHISDSFDAYIPNVKVNNKHIEFVALGMLPNMRLLSPRASGDLPHAFHGDVKSTFKESTLNKPTANKGLVDAVSLEAKPDNAINNHNHAHTIDWHLWLNPDNALLMMAEIKKVLSRLEPHNALQFEENYKLASEEVMQTTTLITEQLMKQMGKSFITLHDGYQYIEDQFGLYSSGTIYEKSSHVQPSIQHMINLRKTINDNNIKCVWREVQYTDRTLKTIFDGVRHKMARIDSLGQKSTNTLNTYSDLLQNIANEIEQCFTPITSGVNQSTAKQ